MNGTSDRKPQRESNAERKNESSIGAVSRVAANALSEVALRAKAVRDNPDARNIELLFDAAVGDDPLGCSAIARQMIGNGIPAEYICDVYIPAIATRMGDQWCEDEMSFSNVTIGTSRLQFLLREIGPGKSDDLRWNSNGEETSVLLLLSRDANHTLGVMVLANQLRRLGFSVKISIGESTDAVIDLFQSSPFDAVFVSASMEDDLHDLRDLVKAIKTHANNPPPVILGGNIVEQSAAALQVTGVDKVTNKLDEALSFCKLRNDGKPK